MGQPRKPSSNLKNPKKTGLPPKKTSPPQKDKRTVRAFVTDVTVGLLVCFLFFFLVEVVLRLAGVSTRDPAEDPFIGFSSIQSLFNVENGVAKVSPPRLRYFNDVSFPVQKSSETMRIFCFGGSTTYGHPFDCRTSFSRWLQDLLQASAPEKNFEVINVGGISYASYRIVPLVRETLKYSPDLMIIYMGHNEFLERRTYSGLFGQGAGVIAVRSLVEQLRIYQVLQKFLAPLFSGRDKPQGHSITGTGPSKSILGGEVTAILDRSAGLELYHRDDEFAKGVVRHFAHNLEAMIDLCKKARVPVMLVDLPSNLKDFSPFKSEHDTGLTYRDQVALNREIERAARLISKGGFESADSLLDKAVGKDPYYAQTYYLKGKALLGIGQNSQARDNFVKAKDLDTCPLRCISAIEDQIVKIARENHVPFVPFKEFVEKRATHIGDQSGIPGNESFLDHVHPTIELHQLLAGLLLDKMVDQRLIKASRTLSGEDRLAIFDSGMKSFDAHFLALRDFNLAKTLKWAGKAEEAREALLRAAEKMDDSPEIHKMLGSFYLDDQRYNEAIQEYSRALSLSGNDPQMEFDLAVVFYKSGLTGKAVDVYERLLKSNHNMPEVFSNLGMIYLESGRVEDALQVITSGMQKNPDHSGLFAPYALALAVSGRALEATPWMLKAVQAEPGDANHLYNLAGMYALTGSIPDAVTSLNLAVDKGYSNVEKLAGDGIFDSLRELPEFQKILGRIRK
jgi:Flp pilus assembly protein TadD/lysophospholipase L1-like esterase